jgi:formate-nitrite transporter family protein
MAMVDAPTPQEIYDAAEAEGRRRLEMPPLEQISTGFIAGVTIVFGIIALGVVEALVEPEFGSGIARLAGGLAFAIGFVFLVIGRSELFSENFFDPVAAAIDDGGRSWAHLARLWVLTLVLNLLGGAVLVAILLVEGALPAGTPEALGRISEEIAAKGAVATLARAVLAGAMVTLLSYMLHGVDTPSGRISLAYMVGFLLALGPFDHVVVSALHLLYGVWHGASGVGYSDVATNTAFATLGNVVGGLVFITLTHTAQVKGARAR